LYRAHKKNLELATEYKHDSIFELLTKKKIDINRTNADGNTALHLAVQNGQEDIVQMLLADKADANKTNQKGFTSLHLATVVAGFSNTSMCSILLKHGADVNRKISNNGNTVLHIAVRTLSTGFLDLFLDNKAQIDIQNNEGTTALGIAVRYDYRDEIRLLLERKANPNLLDKSGKTVLEIACGSHNHSTAKILIQGGASVEPMKEYTAVLLADAAAEEDKELAKLIVEAREVQPQLDHLYGMALRAAVRSGHFESIKWLLEAGGSPHWQDEYGWSVFDLASSLRREGIVSQLQKYSSPSALSLHATKSATPQESGMRWRKRQIGETNDLVISDLEVSYSGKLEESLTLALRLNCAGNGYRALVEGSIPFPLPRALCSDDPVPAGDDAPPTASSLTDDKPDIYFEITVLKTDDEGYGISLSQAHPILITVARIVGLGLTNGPLRYFERMPGWDEDTWGYHGDDGDKFHSSGSSAGHIETYGPGDTVGCGVIDGRLFFTKNGRDLGAAH
jgi:ankyrin repeat protein